MEPPHDDEFKWFGEGFEGFPRRLPDNTVEYSIFVAGDGSKSHANVHRRLTEILKHSKQYTKALLKEHIWQHDPFDLVLEGVPIAPDGSSTSTAPLHLHGRTSFGDSISDEWLIVYILLEISKKHSDAWIRVTDSDGEFLLIEAANALPEWLNPDVAENRIWISNGHLRIIPLKDEGQQNLKLEVALAFITDHRDELIISPFIEDAAFARVKDYPAAIENNLHHAQITIPRKLAYVLHQNAAYISPAIDAFYLRDAVALQPLATKDLSTLRFAPEDFVTVSIKFTKVGYAQLRGQVFDTPPSWIGLQPRMQDEKVQMGMKLACGFEMMLADQLNKDKKVIREVQLLLDELESSEVELPDGNEIAGWSQRQDDEKWLTIDYNDFEAELAGKSKDDVDTGTAQDNLRKMVSQFQQFVDADTEDVLGAEDHSDDESEVSSTGEDKDGSFDEAEFERAMKQMMGMSEESKQESGLLEEARKLAIDDGEVSKEEEDRETKEMMAMIEEELKEAGALRKQAGRPPKASKDKSVMFGPEPPPGFKRQDDPESADEEIGPGQEELSSDDEEFNDVDVNLARNLLSSFKGQAGASGPAGNMLKALGINMPRDEDSD
ncbi:hypothetical protein AMS68_005887 [Peltaster fructicola]|uniref:Uncharacterized protein n=1 Tax=Peltaster fructicola TaxID=286661 RepID=A0A6H0Y142_9PEZI|nr:hypothetical protein AMS68_005887 [Peltaster fructicola]